MRTLSKSDILAGSIGVDILRDDNIELTKINPYLSEIESYRARERNVYYFKKIKR